MSNNSEEEYQFPDDVMIAESVDEVPADYHTSSPADANVDSATGGSAEDAVSSTPSSGFIGKLRAQFMELSPISKKGIIGLFIFILLVCSLLVTNIFESKSSSATDVKEEVKKTVAPKNPVVAVTTPESSDMPVMPVVNNHEQEKTDKKMKALQSSVEKLSAQLSESLKQQQMMSQQLVAMHQSSDASVHNSSVLHNKVNELDAKLKVFNNDLKSASKHKSKLASSFKYYHLESMVPGRAWIDDQYGHVYTVEVGDILKDFGRVVRIDSDQSLVVSQTGAVIKYGNNVAVG